MRSLLLALLAIIGFSFSATAHEPASSVVWVNPDCAKGTCFCLVHTRTSNVTVPLSVISGGQSTTVVSQLPKAVTVVFPEVQIIKPVTATVIFPNVPAKKTQETKAACACNACTSPQYVIEQTYRRGLFGPKVVTKVFGTNE
jgi:hypothetical protein